MESTQDVPKTSPPTTPSSDGRTSSLDSPSSTFKSTNMLPSRKEGQEQAVADGLEVPPEVTGGGAGAVTGLENQVGAHFEGEALLQTDDSPQSNVTNSVSSEGSNNDEEGGKAENHKRLYKLTTAPDEHLASSVSVDLRGSSLPSSSLIGSGKRRTQTKIKTSSSIKYAQHPQAKSCPPNEQPGAAHSLQRRTPVRTYLPKFSKKDSSNIPRIALDPETPSSGPSSNEPLTPTDHSSTATRCYDLRSTKLHSNQDSPKLKLSDSSPSCQTVSTAGKFDGTEEPGPQTFTKSPSAQDLSSTSAKPSSPDSIIARREKKDPKSASRFRSVSKIKVDSPGNSAKARDSPRKSEDDSPKTPTYLVCNDIFDTTRSRRASRRQSAQSLLKSRRKLPFDFSEDALKGSNSPDLKRNSKLSDSDGCATLSEHSDSSGTRVIDVLPKPVRGAGRHVKTDLADEPSDSATAEGMSGTLEPGEVQKEDGKSSASNRILSPRRKMFELRGKAALEKQIPHSSKASSDNSSKKGFVSISRRVSVNPERDDSANKIQKGELPNYQEKGADLLKKKSGIKPSSSQQPTGAKPKTYRPATKNVSSMVKPKRDANESQENIVPPILKNRPSAARSKIPSPSHPRNAGTAKVSSKLRSDQPAKSIRDRKEVVTPEEQNEEAVIDRQNAEVQTDEVFISYSPEGLKVMPCGTRCFPPLIETTENSGDDLPQNTIFSDMLPINCHSACARAAQTANVVYATASDVDDLKARLAKLEDQFLELKSRYELRYIDD